MTTRFGSWLYNEQTGARSLRIATVAMSCDRDPDANRRNIADTVDAIAQAHPDVELVLFGEMILGWYKPGDMPAYHHCISEPIRGATVQALASLAAQHGIYLCFGMSEKDGSALYNAQVLLNPQGDIQAVHRKWNLKRDEKGAGYLPGSAPVTITDIKGLKTGIVICSDAASPSAMWELMRSRLDLILLSLADDNDEGRFMARFNARMYDAWIVTANRYGQENGRFWNGHVVVSDPCGKLRAAGQDREGYLPFEVRCENDTSWLRRAIRNTYVKAPLVSHLLRNWRTARAYL